MHNEAEARSKWSIYVALAANVVIALSKFIAAGFSRSSAMLSEGVHSLVDMSTELLLLFGIKRSKKHADRKRPFGYGKEVYFWSFVVSILIFALGAGVAFFQGVSHLREPKPMIPSAFNYIVLAIALVFEGISFWVALKHFNADRRGRPFWQTVRETRDASLIIVLFEESADIIGIMLAFAAIFFGHLFHAPYLDGIASLLIGLVLTGVSILMTRESKSLLMGEAAKSRELNDIVKIVEADDDVIKVKRHRSMVYGPEETILSMDVKFTNTATASQVVKASDRIRHEIRKKYKKFTRIFIEPVM